MRRGPSIPEMPEHERRFAAAVMAFRELVAQVLRDTPGDLSFDVTAIAVLAPLMEERFGVGREDARLLAFMFVGAALWSSKTDG